MAGRVVGVGGGVSFLCWSYYPYQMRPRALLCRKYNELSSFIELPIASGGRRFSTSKCSAWFSRMQMISFITFQCSVIVGTSNLKHRQQVFYRGREEGAELTSGGSEFVTHY